MDLYFGGVSKFRWIFVIADVKHNILGIDFLRHFSLTIDFTSSKLNSHLSQSSFPLVIKLVCHVEFSNPFLVTNEYFEMPESFSDLTRPPNKEKPIKHDVVHDIVTTGYLCHAHARPLPPDKLEVVRNEIEYLLEADIISRSNSNYASSLHLVPKKDSGKFRLVGDYRNLNRQTIPDLYPTPSVQSLLHHVSGASIFSKIDFVKAYHQIPLAPAARKKTATICPLRLFEYNIMPFGLRNASATFQRFIDGVCHGMPYVLACVDDIIVFSKNKLEHKQPVLQLFQRLNEFEISINVSKCEFGKHQIMFLGHLISHDGIKPLPDKMEAIQKCPLPSNVKQLRRFHGAIQFYNRFIPKAAQYLSPLNDMLHGNAKGSKSLPWYEEAKTAFFQSKSLLADVSLLVFPTGSSPMSIYTDASDIAIAAVLQIKQLGVWRPVAFFSWRLDKTQQKYSIFDRELLAAYSAIKHFRHFLECRQFTLFTDHKPLVHAFQSTPSQEHARRARHLSYIAEYTNDIRHVVGLLNFTAGALSRVQINNIEYFQNGLDYEQMALSQTTDAVIQDLLQNNVTSLQLKQFALSRTSPSLIWWDVSTGAIRPVVPDSFRKDVFHKLHSLSHPGIKSTIRLITQRFVWPNMKKDIRAWVHECTICQANKIHQHNFSEFKPYALPIAVFKRSIWI